jgi:hypothetical protein
VPFQGRLRSENREQNLANSTPSSGVVEKWIAQAKETEPRISH